MVQMDVTGILDQIEASANGSDGCDGNIRSYRNNFQ